MFNFSSTLPNIYYHSSMFRWKKDRSCRSAVKTNTAQPYLLNPYITQYNAFVLFACLDFLNLDSLHMHLRDLFPKWLLFASIKVTLTLPTCSSCSKKWIEYVPVKIKCGETRDDILISISWPHLGLALLYLALVIFLSCLVRSLAVIHYNTFVLYNVRLNFAIIACKFHSIWSVKKHKFIIIKETYMNACDCQGSKILLITWCIGGIPLPSFLTTYKLKFLLWYIYLQSFSIVLYKIKLLFFKK